VLLAREYYLYCCINQILKLFEIKLNLYSKWIHYKNIVYDVSNLMTLNLDHKL
jgi:hypothetical protein